MALIPVNRETLGSKRLKPLTSFAHLAKVPVCEIAAIEFPAAALSFPIVFIQRNGLFSPVALFSLGGNDNLFVGADGRWTAAYVPALLRAYPFVVQGDGKGGLSLMIEDASGLLSDTEGEALFGTDEKSDDAAPVGRALKFAGETAVQGNATRMLIDKIAAAGIIQSLDAAPSPGAQPVATGLFMVDEARLNALSDQALLDLRQAGALGPIYTHLVSLGQMPQLRARHEARQAAAGGAPNVH